MSEETLGPRQRAAATKRARTRKMILDAARPLCDEYGYQGTTREQVAKAAAVAMPTLSKHFPLKRSLVVAAYEPELLPFIERAKDAVATEGDAREALIAFVRELAVMLTDHPTLCRALLPIGREEDPADQFHPLYYELEAVFGKLIETHWKGEPRYGREPSSSAQYHLMGLLGGISPPNPPRPAEVFSSVVLMSVL
ncbi:transcriptional regulator, TetR family [Streptomyces ipomoeae 91-03]|uniref:Transcriptional regulator, TetR family n=2 Tax=Streptomyces ipomoeae TaxID=103232 RepID=L1KJT3_9ACTN|nr:transcriptional regulator, TetR family [Streptomyces ipomoeae 91-03]